MEEMNLNAAVSVKDIILECDLQELQRTVAEKMHVRPGTLREELDAAVAELVDQIKMTEVICDPKLVAIHYITRYDGCWSSETGLFSRGSVAQLKVIPQWDEMEDQLFPGEDLDAFGKLDVALWDIPELLSLADMLPEQIRWMLRDFERVLSAAVPYSCGITRRLLAGDILREYFAKEGFLTKRDRDMVCEQTDVLLDRPFDTEMWISNMKEDLYNKISLYHELWTVHNILFQ